MPDIKFFYLVIVGIVGMLIGLIVMSLIVKAQQEKARNSALDIVEEARERADNLIKEAKTEGRKDVAEYRLQVENVLDTRKKDLDNQERIMLDREKNLNIREQSLSDKEKNNERKSKDITDKIQKLDSLELDLNHKMESQVLELERIAELSTEEAKVEILDRVKDGMSNEITAFMRDQEDEARSKAQEVAKNIIGLAIQGSAQEEAQDRTVSVVSLPNEEMKGRIIGREGRNIRAIEKATGVDLIIDDTPEVITVSCFDPIRREVAKMAIEHLVKDGRIQPSRIEEVVYKMQKELEDNILKVGEDAVFKLGVGRMDRELIKLVGRLRYRYSYGQNVLDHSLEVAHIAGVMAAELGLSQSVAKRAGLLHDIGKALDFEMEGTHVELGYKVAKKYGEDDIVLNAIQSHHGDVEATHLISNLVEAADTLSAARPGARHESFENYIRRLEELEAIGDSFEGVKKSYAIQAGREIRVIAIPDKLDDHGCYRTAREIKERIENELTYPGQVKVTVIRETRASATAK